MCARACVDDSHQSASELSADLLRARGLLARASNRAAGYIAGQTVRSARIRVLPFIPPGRRGADGGVAAVSNDEPGGSLAQPRHAGIAGANPGAGAEARVAEPG